MHDHPALDAAVANGGPIVALYVMERGAEADSVVYPRRTTPAPPSFSSTAFTNAATKPSTYPLASNPGSPSSSDDSDRTSPEPISYNGPVAPTGGFSLGRVPSLYLHHSLCALRDSLLALGITLIIRRTEKITQTADQVSAIARALGATDVYWNRRDKPNAYPVDDEIRHRLYKRHINACEFSSETLMQPDVHACGVHNDFKSYARFCIAEFRDRPPQRPVPPLTPNLVHPMRRSDVKRLLSENESNYLKQRLIPPFANTILPGVEALGLSGGVDDGHTPAPLDKSSIGCIAAKETLRRFLAHDRFQSFANDDARRDGMVTDEDLPTSRLSPHIRFGEISPRVIFYAVVDTGARAKLNGNESCLMAARTFLKNISLREFGYYLLSRYPCAAKRPIMPEFEAFPWEEDPNDGMLQAWQHGTTGFPLIDAAMRQLWREGWLHNKMRFVVASFFCKYLLLPWPLGADHLVRTLVDGDEACNSLGWQWTAGCNSDSFPFSTLINPSSFQTHTRSVKRAMRYVRKYVPELAHLPDNLLITPWKATREERTMYKIALVPIDDYRMLTGNRLPPMNEYSSALPALYPMRIVDGKQARERSRKAMDLMRRIFSMQRQCRKIFGEQKCMVCNGGCIDSERKGCHGDGCGNIRRRTVEDEDGNLMSEIDVTGVVDSMSTDTPTELTSLPLSNESSPKRPYEDDGGDGMDTNEDEGQCWKKRKTETLATVIESEERPMASSGNQVDLMALCEVANLNNPMNDSDDGKVVVKSSAVGGRKSAKRPRRSVPLPKSSSGSVSRLSVQALLVSNQTPPSSETRARSDMMEPDCFDPGQLGVANGGGQGGLPGLAQIASCQEPVRRGTPAVNGHGLQMGATVTTASPVGYSPAISGGQPMNDMTQFGEHNGLNGLSAPNGVSAMPSHMFSNGQHHVGPGGNYMPLGGRAEKVSGKSRIVAGGIGSGSGVVEPVSHMNGHHMAPAKCSDNMNVMGTRTALGYDTSNATPAAANNLYHAPAVPPMPLVQNTYASLAHAHPNTHGQHQMMIPYRHQNGQLASVPHMQPHISSMHGSVGSQGYFPAAGTMNAMNTGHTGQAGHPFIWYPTVQPFVDIRTGLPPGAMLPPQMIHPVQHPPTMPITYPDTGASGAGVGAPRYDHAAAAAVAAGHVGALGVENGQAVVAGRRGPSTPREREEIARRMAAMDYHDETYGGKHWEQWQAIALHLLNSYEFSEDTERETSRAYVRLCVLKDELRDANPSGPRVTVNHCKEVFKILQLPVTGEWDRRGHGGVRGPYVYGCTKRNSAQDIRSSASR